MEFSQSKYSSISNKPTHQKSLASSNLNELVSSRGNPKNNDDLNQIQQQNLQENIQSFRSSPHEKQPSLEFYQQKNNSETNFEEDIETFDFIKNVNTFRGDMTDDEYLNSSMNSSFSNLKKNDIINNTFNKKRKSRKVKILDEILTNLQSMEAPFQQQNIENIGKKLKINENLIGSSKKKSSIDSEGKKYQEFINKKQILVNMIKDLIQDQQSHETQKNQEQNNIDQIPSHRAVQQLEEKIQILEQKNEQKKEELIKQQNNEISKIQQLQDQINNLMLQNQISIQEGNEREMALKNNLLALQKDLTHEKRIHKGIVSKNEIYERQIEYLEKQEKTFQSQIQKLEQNFSEIQEINQKKYNDLEKKFQELEAQKSLAAKDFALQLKNKENQFNYNLSQLSYMNNEYLIKIEQLKQQQIDNEHLIKNLKIKEEQYKKEKQLQNIQNDQYLGDSQNEVNLQEIIKFQSPGFNHQPKIAEMPIDEEFTNDLENIDDLTERVDFSGKDKQNSKAFDVNKSFKEETPGSEYDYIDNVAEFNTSLNNNRTSVYSNNRFGGCTPGNINDLSKSRLSSISGISKIKQISPTSALGMKEIKEHIPNEEQVNTPKSQKDNLQENYNSPRFQQTFGKNEDVCQENEMKIQEIDSFPDMNDLAQKCNYESQNKISIQLIIEELKQSLSNEESMIVPKEKEVTEGQLISNYDSQRNTSTKNGRRNIFNKKEKSIFNLTGLDQESQRSSLSQTEQENYLNLDGVSNNLGRESFDNKKKYLPQQINQNNDDIIENLIEDQQKAVVQIDDQLQGISENDNGKLFIYSSKIEKEFQDFQKEFKYMYLQVETLKKKLEEADWTNRELKHSVKEKNLQIKKLINNIERVEKILQKQKKSQKQKLLNEEEQLEIDMYNLKYLSIKVDDEEDLSCRKSGAPSEPDAEQQSFLESNNQMLQKKELRLKKGDRVIYDEQVNQISDHVLDQQSQDSNQNLLSNQIKQKFINVLSQFQDFKKAAGFIQ